MAVFQRHEPIEALTPEGTGNGQGAVGTQGKRKQPQGPAGPCSICISTGKELEEKAGQTTGTVTEWLFLVQCWPSRSGCHRAFLRRQLQSLCLPAGIGSRNPTNSEPDWLLISLHLIKAYQAG